MRWVHAPGTGAVLLSNSKSLSRLSCLVGALEARSEEIVALLHSTGFWSCGCPECRGTVH
jgi:hypothetical protein